MANRGGRGKANDPPNKPQFVITGQTKIPPVTSKKRGLGGKQDCTSLTGSTPPQKKGNTAIIDTSKPSISPHEPTHFRAADKSIGILKMKSSPNLVSLGKGGSAKSELGAEHMIRQARLKLAPITTTDVPNSSSQEHLVTDELIPKSPSSSQHIHQSENSSSQHILSDQRDEVNHSQSNSSQEHPAASLVNSSQSVLPHQDNTQDPEELNQIQPPQDHGKSS